MNENPMPGDAPPRAAGAKEKIKEKAASYASSAKQQAQQKIDQRMSTVRGELHAFVSALRDAERRLKGDEGSAIGAMLVGQLANRLDTFGSTLDGKDLDTVVTDIESFARRNPAVFLSAAAGIGFLAARFVKSTAQNAARNQMMTASRSTMPEGV